MYGLQVGLQQGTLEEEAKEQGEVQKPDCEGSATQEEYGSANNVEVGGCYRDGTHAGYR